MGKQILTRIKEELQKMKQSRDVAYTETYIHWKGKRGFSVECVRIDEDYKIYNEDGMLIDDRSGEPAAFEVYYQSDEKDIDVCTLSPFLDDADMKSLEEFVRMYR